MLHPLQSTIYDNCHVLDKDGEEIFYCSIRKAKWYLAKGLAVLVSDQPFIVQLNFITNGPGNKNDPFYLQLRDSICVVCGSEKKLTKHHVVPCSFRKHMGAEYKEHAYHDIVPLCISCHEQYNTYEKVFRKQLEIEYDAPLDGIDSNASTIRNQRYIRDLARVITKYGDKIPRARLDFLIEKLKMRAGSNDIDIQNVAAVNVKLMHAITTQAQIILSKTEPQNIIRRWRQHFVDTMQPKFLPKHWSVDRVGK